MMCLTMSHLWQGYLYRRSHGALLLSARRSLPYPVLPGCPAGLQAGLGWSIIPLRMSESPVALAENA